MHIPLGRYWSLLALYLAPLWQRMLILAVVLICSIALQLASPQIVRSFLDMVVAGTSLSALLGAAALFCLVGVLGLATSVLATYLGGQIGWAATNDLRANLAAHALGLDLPFHHAHPPGEMIERLDGDVMALRNFFSHFAIQLASNLLLIAGVLVLLMIEDFRIGAVFAVFTCITLWVFNRVRDSASPFWHAALEASAQQYSHLEEWLGGVPDLRVNGASRYIRRRFDSFLQAQLRRRRTAVAMTIVVGNGAELLLVLGSITALATGVLLFQSSIISIGTVYLITAYAALINRPLQELIRQLDDLQQASASISRIEALLSFQPSVRDGTQTLAGAGAPALAFEDVSFAYGAQEQQPEEHQTPQVLHSISFQLQPGQILGLIGRTGSGKTSMTRLLLRLYDPQAGRILLNGTDIRTLRLEELRRRIGIVTQDVHLFQATVRDNLTLFNQAIPDQRILDVIDELGLVRWFDSLPAGLESRLDAGGAGLSAGEAQLLAVARVFLREPDLVILDEASSRLDPHTERQIERAFDRLLKPSSGPRTAIIIAHRLRTVQRADTILLLEDGLISEYGPRIELEHNPTSRFAQLLQLGREHEGILQ